LAERFEENRTHQRAMAYRMLGSLSEADDAVQESWLRLSRSGTSGVENLGGWLTTVTARVCLDMLRSRKSRREELVNGAAGLVWAPGGRPRVVFGFGLRRGKIVEIDMIAAPERLRRLDLAVLND
jgi:DNA-directed RNA polymerase specialized sigma24 family protein